MATVYSDAYWTGSYTYTRVKVDYSGTTATATLLYTRTNTYSGATGAGNPAYFYFGKSNSYGTATISGATFYGQQTDAVVGSCTFSISEAGGTYSGYTYNAGYVGGDTSWSSPAWSVTIPSQYTKPAKPTVSTSVSSDTQINVTYGTTSWGNPNSGTVYLYGGTSTAPTTQIASKTTTGNSTYSHTGLSANTMYYYRARANNGQLNSDYSTEVSAVTKAPKTTLSLNSASSDSLVINYSAPADGGKYAKTLQYSIDSGSTWTTAATISSGSATTGNFTISGLSANTQYTIQSRVTTTAGTTTNDNLTASTVGPTTPTLTLANNGSDYRIQTATYGTTSFGGGSEGVVVLFRSIVANPTAKVDSKTTTGTSTYSGSGLTGNKLYYYRAKAGAVFGSGKNYFLVPDSLATKVNDNAITATRTSDGSGGTSFVTVVCDLAPNTTYTLSYDKVITGDVLNRTGEVRIRKDGSWTSTWDSTGTLTFTTGDTGEIAFGFYNYFSDSVGGTNTVAWSNIQVEKGSSKTSFVSHNVSYVWSPYVSKTLATRPPVLTISSASTLEYETASTVTARVQISVPADGGYSAQKKIQYRYSTDGGSTFTAWVDGPTISTSSATTTYVDYTGLPVSTAFVFSVRQMAITGSLTSNTSTKSYTSPGQHQGPTNFDWVLSDNNTNIQNFLDDYSGYVNPIFIQGKSRAKITIPRATEGTPSDGATLVNYKTSIPTESTTLTINWASGSSDMTGMFANGIPSQRATDFPSNQINVSTEVLDSLSTKTTVTKSVLVLSYQNPTIAASAERLSTMGSVLIRYSGSIARLQDNSLNSGNDINQLYLRYRILDNDGQVIVDWTTIPAPTMTIDTNKPFLKNFSSNFTLTDVPYATPCKVELRAADKVTSRTISIPLEIWDVNQVIYPPDYEIELWDWKTGTFVADISYLVIGPINIEWTLNDAEEVSFELDLERFEKKCQEMGIASTTLLAPYAHDIRIRRNGTYILGCQLVETNIQLSNNPPAKIQVKGTGFLNLFKDQYVLNEAWSGYSYSEIARKLVEYAQKPDCLVKNPTGDIDTSYWLAANGVLFSSADAEEGDRCIGGSRSGTGWISLGTQMSVDSGETIDIDLWVKGQSGVTAYFREREYVTQSNNQSTITSISLNGSWQHVQFSGYKTLYDHGYLLAEMSRTNSSSYLLLDEVRVYPSNDTVALSDMHVALGVDTASATQDKTRQVNYELQNVKDALLDLVNMEEDNFDFEFLVDRTFCVYSRKGADKLDLDVTYPGNMDSMTISRSAANMANKIIALGSGIGDERLQVEIYNNVSRGNYGTRESVTTDSNISLKSTLLSKAIGNLYDRKDPTNLPKIKIKDGSINPSNVETGDVLAVAVDGVSYIESVTGQYRIQKIKLEVSENAVETMDLTVEPPVQRPEKKTIRYIKDIMSGNSVNNSNHWVEIQALMLVGNEYVDVALGKTVTATSGGTNLSRVTDGNMDVNSYASTSSGQGVIIDLGDEYPIDYVKVWHYWADGRTYYTEHLSVGSTLTSGTSDLETVLWSYSGNTGYVETANGRRSGWIQEGNIVNGGS